MKEQYNPKVLEYKSPQKVGILIPNTIGLGEVCFVKLLHLLLIIVFCWIFVVGILEFLV